MSRYHKKIATDANGLIDLYAIAEAFGVKSNPQFHAMKKIMMAGERGHKSLVQDIDEAIIAAQRWKEMVTQECVTPTQFNAPPLCSACHMLHHVGAPCSARGMFGQMPAPFDSRMCPGCYSDPSPHPRTSECTRL